MKIFFRKTVALGIGICLAFSATFASTAARTVAVLPFEAPDSPGRNSTRAADLSAFVQAKLETDDSRIWVDRQRLDDVFAELALSRSGLSSAETVRTGNLIGADLLIRGLIRTNNASSPAIDLEVIHPQKAQSLARSTIPFSAPLIARRLQWNPEDAERIAGSIRQLLHEAEENLIHQAGQKTVVPLFFQNIGPHARLSFLEEDLQQAIHEKAGKSKSGFHILRFPAAHEAVDEAELALLGLTENREAWEQLADLYIWGTFREIDNDQAETAFDTIPIEVTLSLWNGMDAPDSVRFESTVNDRQNLVQQVAQAVAAAAERAKPSEFLAAVREPVATTLLQRDDEVAVEIAQRGGTAFSRSEAGRNLYRYRLKLLATARFLNPASLEIQQRHLETAWTKSSPLDPLSTSAGHRNRMAAFREFARKNRTDSKIHLLQIEAILEAAQALARHERLDLDVEEAYLQSRILSETFRDEARAYLQANAESPEAKSRAVTDWFRALYVQKTWRDAEIVFNLTEDFWPHFREHYLQWRDSAPDHEFNTATSHIRGAYARFGIEAMAIARLTEPSPARRSSLPETTEVPATPPTSLKIETGSTDASKPDSHNSISFKEIVFWPQTFYRRQDPESLRLETEPLHDFSFLKFSDGLLWIGETARRPLASRDWRNPAGNHYLWKHNPATRTTENLSRKLAPHTIPTAVLPHNGDLWIGFTHDGLYQLSESTNALRKWTGEDGLLTTSVHALTAAESELLIAGGSGDPALNRLHFGETVLHDLAIPAQLSRSQSFSSQHPPAPADLGALWSVAEFNGWLAVTGHFPAIRNPRTAEWQMLTAGPDWSRLPQPPIQIETARERFPQYGRERDVLSPKVEADNHGFWFVSEQSLSFVNPESGENAGIILPGIRAAAHQNDFLWLAVHDSATSFDEKTRNHLLLFNKKNRTWITSIPFESDASITALAASSDRLWIGAGRLYEIDISAWTGESDPVTSSSFPLHVAARYRDLAATRKLLSGGADPNRATPDGWTPLLAAVDAGSPDIVRELLEAGANPDTLYRSSEFPLRLAAERGNTEIARLLLDHGSEVDFQGGEPLFHFWEEELSRANLLRDQEKAEEIRRARTAIETPDRRVAISTGSWPAPVLPKKETALMAAARAGKTDLVRLLLQEGAQPDVSDLYGDTALMHALRNGQKPVADLLVEAGADSAIGNLSGETPAQLAQQAGIFLERSSSASFGIPEVVPYETSLMRAASIGQIDEIQRLLETGENPNAVTAGGTSAVSRAIYARQTAAALYLLDHGFQPLAQFTDPNRLPSRSRWEEEIGRLPLGFREIQRAHGYEAWLREHEFGKGLVGETALLEAARRENIPVLTKLLDLGMSPDTDIASVTPLMEASARGHVETVALLINRGANRELRRSDGQTALQLAANDEIRRLLSDGGEIEARPLPATVGPPLYVGIPPAEPVVRARSPLDKDLFNAATDGAEAKVKDLLSRGAFPDARDDKLWTPLFYATQGGHLKTVEILLEAGATLNVVTEQGSSPLVFAILSENDALVERLLELGANPNLYRQRSTTPLQVALLHNPGILELLLQYGALPGLLTPMRDLTYDAPLSAAARIGNLEIAEQLLSYGAPVDGNFTLYRTPIADDPARIVTGPSPFVWAAYSDSVEIMHLLLRNGANPMHLDPSDCTALCYAVRGDAVRATKLLLDLGLSDEHALELAKEKGNERIVHLLER